MEGITARKLKETDESEKKSKGGGDSENIPKLRG